MKERRLAVECTDQTSWVNVKSVTKQEVVWPRGDKEPFNSVQDHSPS
jgi:hypothetical protein